MYNEGSFAEGFIAGTNSHQGYYNNGMFGGDGAWWIIILLIFGWGGNGFGFGGNGGYMNGALTRSDLCQDINFNNLESSVRGVQSGLCDGFYAMNTSLLTGFASTDRAIDGVNYNLAKSTCDIINAGNANTQKILDFLTQDQIAQLRAENTLLTNQLSQNSQTNAIINALRPVAQPAYITCSPFESSFGFLGNRSGSCGCGCGCNL